MAHHLPPRYNFCVFVDEEYLRSLDSKFPALKVLARNWDDEESEEGSEDEDDNENEDQEEIGWIYMDGAIYLPMLACILS